MTRRPAGKDEPEPGESRLHTRVLGVDTSLRSTGFGVVEVASSRMRVVECGVLAVPASSPLSEALLRLQRGLMAVVERCEPQAAAVEGIFFCRNARTAMMLGHARGVVVAVCAAANLPVFEYAPRRVKQAVVGYGAAGKEQVGRMIASLLGLDRPPQEDAADALALAVCHLNSQSRYRDLAPTRI